jgi:hypothetical protein
LAVEETDDESDPVNEGDCEVMSQHGLGVRGKGPIGSHAAFCVTVKPYIPPALTGSWSQTGVRALRAT